MKTLHPSVSEDLQRTLEQLAAQTPENCKEELCSFVGNWRTLADYDFCLWWQGCYYCRSEAGDWKKVTCHI